jgi:hypothetical protein
MDDRCQNQKWQDGRSTLKCKLWTLVDFTNIIEPSSTNNIASRELGITGALKFENCNCNKTK